jgi:hypothetical protein
LNRAFYWREKILKLSGVFEFDHQSTAGRAVKERVQRLGRVPGMTGDRHGHSPDPVMNVRAHALPQGPAERFQRNSEDFALHAEKRGGVGARLHDDAIDFPDEEQRAVRLDRSGELNLFPLAIGQVRRAEGGGIA